MATYGPGAGNLWIHEGGRGACGDVWPPAMVPTVDATNPLDALRLARGVLLSAVEKESTLDCSRLRMSLVTIVAQDEGGGISEVEVDLSSKGHQGGKES